MPTSPQIRRHINENKKFYTGLSALTIGTALDLGLTQLSIDKYGMGIEKHPLLYNSINYSGITFGLTVPKLLGASAIALIVKRYYLNAEEKIGNICMYTAASAQTFFGLSQGLMILFPELAKHSL